MHWAEDRYWTDALERFRIARERGETTVALDLAETEKNAFHDDGPAYRLMKAMGTVLESEGREGYRGAPRLLLATLMHLAELSQLAQSAKGESYVPDTVSLSPSPDPVARRAVRVLGMVHELHKAGYQRLRICAGYTLDLLHWRCYIGPAAQFHKDGWTPTENTELLYTTSQGNDYFGWTDATQDDARSLAAKFLERYSELARQAAGEDLAYAGWFTRILGRAEQGCLPEFFGGRDYHLGETPTRFPPPLTTRKPYAGTGQRLIAHEELTLADLPPPDADYESLWPFCLSFDGYRAARLAGLHPDVVTADAERDGLEKATIECLRITAFMLQRTIKWGNGGLKEAYLVARIHSIVEEIRRRLSR
jgi:hypothetical protein